jgi:hypothetical protein
MARLYLKLAARLFMAMATLIHMQPYDDHVLENDGCTANRLWIATGVLCPVKQPYEPFRQMVFLQWFGSTRMNLNPSSAWVDVYQGC